ncbi:MAG: L-threonylcarbamoyladenylate synthase [Oscillospiraceae bacterium]
MFDTKLLSSEFSDIEYAAELIKKGEVVGMPTETVYGLAADAENEQAVKKIFAAKGRPSDNPLIVHLSAVEAMEKYVCNVPELAYKIAEKFCPGPITMVLPKRSNIPYTTSGGLETVGIRIPFHKTARLLIELSEKAIAAPSANLSGSPSPTTAQHVMNDMNGRIPAIIDGGACGVGVESTVISFENGGIRLLRPGYVSAEDLSGFGVPVFTDKGIVEPVSDGEKVLSPGMKYKHYSPKANVTIVCGEYDAFVNFVKQHNGSGVCAMIFDSDKPCSDVQTMTYGDTSEEQAAQLFAALRRADELGLSQLYVRCPSRTGVGLAVYNRLLRAAGFEVINV